MVFSTCGMAILATFFLLYIDKKKIARHCYYITVFDISENGEDEWKIEFGLNENYKFLLGGMAICISVLFTPIVFLQCLGFILLCIASYIDIKTQTISDGITLLIFLICCGIGFQSHNIATSVLACILLCAYDLLAGDSDLMGGADIILILAGLSLFDISSWIIFILIACIAGIGLKLCLWIIKRDDLSDHGIPFIPALSLSFVITTIVRQNWGHLYTISFRDIIWLMGGI